MFIRKDRIARAKIKINMCVKVHEFMCTVYIQEHMVVRGWHWMPWNWSFEWLLAPVWVQWNECRSSIRTASVPTSSAIILVFVL